ncbi:MAG: hypothetical protein ACJAZ2_002380, partial [Glaciecola sp.]
KVYHHYKLKKSPVKIDNKKFFSLSLLLTLFSTQR